MASFEDSAILLSMRSGSEPVIPSLCTNNLTAVCENKVAFAFERFIYVADTLDKRSPLQVVASPCADAAFGIHRWSLPQRGTGSNEFIVALGAAWIQVIETEEVQNVFSYKIPAANARPGIVHFAQSMCVLTPGSSVTKHRSAPFPLPSVATRRISVFFRRSGHTRPPSQNDSWHERRKSHHISC